MKKIYPQDTSTSKFHCVEIEDYGKQIIQENISTGDLCTLLYEEYRLNVNKEYTGSYQFYTDGSLE